VDDRDSIFSSGREWIFSLHHCVLKSTQPTIQCVSGGGDLSLGLRQLGREADSSPQLVPRLEMRGVILPLTNTSSSRGALLSGYVFTAWCFVKHRDNFTFTLTN
jgi:hypothetical protein